MCKRLVGSNPTPAAVTLRWSRVHEALWLRPRRDPRTGCVGGRVWWWVLPFLVLFALEEALPGGLADCRTQECLLPGKG